MSTVGLPSRRPTWQAQSHQNLMKTRPVYRSARNVSWANKKALTLTEDKTWQAAKGLRGHQNPPLRPRSRTEGFWGAIVGLEDLAKPSPFHIEPKAHVEKEETFEGEQGRPKLLKGTAEDHPVLSQLRSLKGKAAHPQRQPF